MPGMSPRKKAAKGRFGVGGLTPPTISITSHVNDQTGVSLTPTFVAVANDDLNGNVSDNITWAFSVDTGNDALTGGTINPTLTATTTQTVTATIISGGETTDAVISITTLTP